MDKILKSGGNRTSGSASIALPGQKLATSKNPRTLTPSETALLQQDLQAALRTVVIDSWNGDNENDDEEENLEHRQASSVQETPAK